MAAERIARAVRVQALAKINLTLRVLGVRADGYHELRTIFQSIALHDTLTCRRTAGSFRIECDDPACPTDATNLVWRAAERVWTASGRRGTPRNAVVRIEKRIPMQAGLGGGSSDAAAAIRAFAALWRVALAPDRVHEIATAIGADVPFFLDGGTALGVERGEVIYPLMDAPPAWVVLTVPPIAVATREAFGWWDEGGRGSGPRERKERLRPCRYASASALVYDGVGEGSDPRESKKRLRPRRYASASALAYDGISERGWGPARQVRDAAVAMARLIEGNDLERTVVAHHPAIARLVKGLLRHGASYAAMSGSGSAVFGLFDRRTAAAAAARALTSRGRRIFLTRTMNREQYARLAGPARLAVQTTHRIHLPFAPRGSGHS